MKIRISSLEHLFVVLGFFLLSGAVVPLLRYGGVEGVNALEGDPVLQGVWAVLYTLVFAVVLVRIPAVARVVPGTLMLWALIVLALASAAWAAYPSTSLRRSAALLGTTLFGLYFGARFTPEQQVRLLGWTFSLIIVASFAMALAFPEYGINHTFHEGAWQGAFIHKNSLGKVMVVGLMLFLVLAGSVSRRWRWVALAGVASCAALIVLSESKTALVLSACLVVVYWILRLRRRLDSTLIVPVAIVVALAGGGAVLSLAANAEAATTALGRDVTLSGRTVLWAVVVDFIGNEPLLGHGYGSFWLGATGPSGAIWRIVRWEVPHAHNGVLDLALELGIVGVALFAWVFVTTLGRSYRSLVRSAHPAAVWPLVVVLITALYNTTETTLLSRNSIYWALFVSAVCTAYRALQPARPVARPDPFVARSYNGQGSLRGHAGAGHVGELPGRGSAGNRALARVPGGEREDLA